MGYILQLIKQNYNPRSKQSQTRRRQPKSAYGTRHTAYGKKDKKKIDFPFSFPISYCL
jgi:hypothetical protein